MTTAVIPCGGRGTRLGTLTRTTPKELLPLRGHPLLAWTLREAAQAGIDRAVIVTSPEKPEIARFLSARPPDRLTVSLVVQPEPHGLGDAITRARAAAGGDTVAVMLPDNFFDHAPQPPVATVLHAHRATGRAAVLLAEIARPDAPATGATGRARYVPRPDGWVDVVAVGAKGGTRFDTGTSPTAVTPIGRLASGPELFDLLEAERARLAPGQELDDVPVLQRLAAAGRLVGVLLRGTFYDLGIPEGYAAAQS